MQKKFKSAAAPAVKGEELPGNFWGKIQPFPKQEEQLELARRVQRGDEAAFNLMVMRNGGLVFAVARRMAGHGIPVEDLVQEGSFALMRAARKYDPERGVQFSTYAVSAIKKQLSRLKAADGAVSKPQLVKQQLAAVLQAQNVFFNQYGRPPTDEELQRATRKTARQLASIFLASKTAISESHIVDGEEASMFDYYPDQDLSPKLQEEENLSLHEVMNAVFETLDDREAMTLKMRFGWAGIPKSTLDEVGVKIGVTKERVRQIQLKIFEKIRNGPYAERLTEFLPE